MATPLASFAPSTSIYSTFVGGVTLEAIKAQLMHMDNHLDTLSDELCQVNTRVGCIARRQVVMGGFAVSLAPSPQASEEESYDDSFGGVDADEDDDASSSSDKEMTASQ